MTGDLLPIIKEAAQIPIVLKEIYGDLAKPGVIQVGKALETIIGLGNTILWPVTLLNEKAKIALEKNLDSYREQLENIPEEDVTEIPPEIGVPVAEKLAYITDEELSQLYINLLAKASTVQTIDQAHPSFVNIIGNLSPDEAVLLKELKGVHDIPFLEARLVVKGKNQWNTLADLLTGLESKLKLTYPSNIVAYLSNFEGLGIIQIRRDIYVIEEGVYEIVLDELKFVDA